MAKQTRQELYAVALLKMGYHEIVSPSRKYRLFERSGSTYVFLGKSGGIRHNTSRKLAGSFAAAESTKATMLRDAMVS